MKFLVVFPLDSVVKLLFKQSFLYLSHCRLDTNDSDAGSNRCGLKASLRIPLLAVVLFSL